MGPDAVADVLLEKGEGNLRDTLTREDSCVRTEAEIGVMLP